MRLNFPLGETDQREVAERRHRSVRDQMHSPGPLGPAGEPRPGKFGAPSEPAHQGHEPAFDGSPRPRFRTDAVQEHDFAAGLEHARELVECRLRVRDRVDDVLRDDHVERGVGEGQPLGVHDREPLDVVQAQAGDAPLRYALLFASPAAAALIGWLLAMVSRQIGHFFFEPKAYDEVNQATHEYKEEIKVGYNLRRKAVLLAIWGLSPVALYLDPTLFGVFERRGGTAGFVRNMSLVWLALGIGGLAFRTVQLFFLKDVQTGLVWMT
jgi:hypothetical protein